MTFRGVLRGGKIELDPDVEFPEGTVFEVLPSKTGGTRGKARLVRSDDPAFQLDRFAIETGREDGASEHDHYVYGSPKRRRANKPKTTRRPKRKPAR